MRPQGQQDPKAAVMEVLGAGPCLSVGFPQTKTIPVSSKASHYGRLTGYIENHFSQSWISHSSHAYPSNMHVCADGEGIQLVGKMNNISHSYSQSHSRQFTDGSHVFFHESYSLGHLWTHR